MARRGENKYVKTLMVSVIVALMLGSLVGYYIARQGDLGKRTEIVGDGICGNFLDAEDQDFCCAEGHKGEPHILCDGEWKYVEGEKICKFVCDDEEILDDLLQECERVEGEWRTFSNGCADSCALARTPETILCAAVLTDGCDCGVNKCWNGKTCEDN
jgi:hypothetical protein